MIRFNKLIYYEIRKKTKFFFLQFLFLSSHSFVIINPLFIYQMILLPPETVSQFILPTRNLNIFSFLNVINGFSFSTPNRGGGDNTNCLKPSNLLLPLLIFFCLFLSLSLFQSFYYYFSLNFYFTPFSLLIYKI